MYGLEVPGARGTAGLVMQHSRARCAAQQPSLRTQMAEAICRQNLLLLDIWHLKFSESMCRNIRWMDGLTHVPLILY